MKGGMGDVSIFMLFNFFILCENSFLLIAIGLVLSGLNFIIADLSASGSKALFCIFSTRYFMTIPSCGYKCKQPE